MKEQIQNSTYKVIEKEGVKYVFFDDVKKELKKEYQIYFKDSTYYVMMKKDFFEALFFDELEFDEVLDRIHKSNSKWWRVGIALNTIFLFYFIGILLPGYAGYTITSDLPFVIQFIVITLFTIGFYGIITYRVIHHFKHVEALDIYRNGMLSSIKNKEFQQRRYDYYGQKRKASILTMSLTKKATPKASALANVGLLAFLLLSFMGLSLYFFMTTESSLKEMIPFANNVFEAERILDIDYYGFEYSNNQFDLKTQYGLYNGVEPCGDYLCSSEYESDIDIFDEEFNLLESFVSNDEIEYAMIAKSDSFVFFEQRFKNEEGECDYVVYTVYDIENGEISLEFREEDVFGHEVHFMIIFDFSVYEDEFVFAGAYFDTEDNTPSDSLLIMYKENQFLIKSYDDSVISKVVYDGSYMYLDLLQTHLGAFSVVRVNDDFSEYKTIYYGNSTIDENVFDLYRLDNEVYFVGSRVFDATLYQITEDSYKEVMVTGSLFLHQPYDDASLISGWTVRSLMVYDQELNLISEGVKAPEEFNTMALGNAFLLHDKLYVEHSGIMYTFDSIDPYYTFDSVPLGIGGSIYVWLLFVGVLMYNVYKIKVIKRIEESKKGL